MITNPMERGRFITLEGIEGAGKSTQVDGLSHLLRERGLNVLTTREPGGSPLSEQLRAVLLDPDHSAMTETTELLLMFAARAQHLEQTIVPALNAGVWVICDRFTDATYAYQGGGRGVDTERIAILENLVQGSLRPDLVFTLDLPPEIGLARARGRGEAADRFEAETLEFFAAVRQVYLQRAQACPQGYRIIDASRSLDQVTSEVSGCLNDFIDRLIMEPSRK